MTITRQSIPILTAVTDLVTVHRIWFYTGLDTCLVPTAEVAELAYQAGLSNSQVKVTGLPVSPEFTTDQRSKAEIRAELGWEPEIPTVLAAGSRRVEKLDEMMTILNHSAYPLQIAVVAGGHDELYELLRATKWHKPVHIYNFVENMPTMLKASDMLLCKAGGLIVSEALAAGLPMFLANVLPGQEEGNAAYVIQNGAGALTETPIALMENLFHWMDNDGEQLKKHTESAVNLGKPQASLEVAALTWEAAHSSPLERKGLHILERTKLMKMMRSASKVNGN
jgi:UDP-N-acetylglucosamine:LPS N-acetylglucosamine transferase